jgi:hypothetical protein
MIIGKKRKCVGPLGLPLTQTDKREDVANFLSVA